MDLHDITKLIAEKEALLETRLHRLTQYEQGNSRDYSADVDSFTVSVLKESIRSLQSEVLALNKLLLERLNAPQHESNRNKEGTNTFTASYNFLFAVILFIIYNAPEKTVCSAFGFDNRCSGGLFNDGSRRFWDCCYWFSINTQYTVLTTIFWAVWKYLEKPSIAVNAKSNDQSSVSRQKED